MWLLNKKNRRLHATLEGNPDDFHLEFHSDFEDDEVPAGVVVSGVMTCPWCQKEAKFQSWPMIFLPGKTLNVNQSLRRHG